MLANTVIANALLASAISVTPLESPADIHWIGVSAPSAEVVWISGSNATIGRSLDGGSSWEYFNPVNQALEFRDIKALDSDHAYALSIGTNGDSRIYYTANGGQSWQLRYRAGGTQFLNCMDMAPNGEAWVYGDSSESNWEMIRGADGRNWLSARNAVDNKPLAGEGGFAASGGCVRFANDSWAIGTGNASTARLLLKRATGIRFKTIDTPMPAGPNAGITSVWPLAADHVLLAGGDLQHAEARPRLMEYRNEQFTALSEPPLDGALYSLTLLPDQQGLLVSNPSGAALLAKREGEWQSLSAANVWNSACAAEVCYLVGKDGYLARFNWRATSTRQSIDVLE
ncbi:WD40/YVTN/BNR-like repeat-containing protein [Pseudidiomarina mangrovi]|uniref:WD40/YVTN/BNR-like repeat-containing protein n=1 Tax=Pseudidiomarina mangrovi TaxID=2487133 RepID=UPI000FCB73E3|nr:hypothetical protein [Pseudidiomarina mangrovi]